MKNKAWKVVWNEDTFGTYLYGSKIWFHSRDDIEFENELMPPGTVIKEWYSIVMKMRRVHLLFVNLKWILSVL